MSGGPEPLELPCPICGKDMLASQSVKVSEKPKGRICKECYMTGSSRDWKKMQVM